jgi:NAD(P)H-dependent FMN reductase
MSTLGGIFNSNTLNHMRISLRWLHGWVIPEQIAVGHVKEAFSEEGRLKDSDLCERVDKMVTSLLKMAAFLSEE